MKKKVADAESLKEQISFQLGSIQKGLEGEESRKSIRYQNFERQNLGLPSDFVNRDFLDNSVGYKDRLEYLVGMVVQ